MSANPKRSPQFLLAAAAIMAVHGAYLLSAHFGFLDPLANDLRQFSFVHHDPGVDFFVLYEAGWDFLHGRNMYLHTENTDYPPEMPFEERYARSLEDGLNRAPWYATFRYIPFFAVTLGVLLNLLPPWGAYWFWILICEAMLWLNCWFTLRRINGERAQLFAIALWFLPFPLAVEFFLGQFNILMAALIFWTALGWSSRARSGYWGHVWWVLSVLLKNYTVGLGLLLIKRRCPRIVALAAGIVLITSLPYFALFPEGWAAFWGAGLSGRIGADAGEWSWGMWGMQGVQSAVGAVLEILSLRTVSVGAFTVGTIVNLFVSGSAVAMTIWRTHRDSNWLRPFCLWIMLWFILYRDCWEHHYIMLLPVMALCLIHGLVNLRALVIVFLLTQTVTMFAILAPSDVAGALQRQGLYDVLRFVYYIIKPAGVIYLFFLLSREKTILMDQRRDRK